MAKLKTGPVEYEYIVKVDSSEADKKIEYIRQNLNTLIEASKKYVAVMEMCKELKIEFTVVEKKKKPWYKFW